MLKMLNAHNAMRTVLENRRITLELRSGNWRKRWAARLLIKRKLPHSFMISWMGTGMPLKRRLPMIPMI